MLTSHFEAEKSKSGGKIWKKCQKVPNISKMAKLRIYLRVGSNF